MMFRDLGFAQGGFKEVGLSQDVAAFDPSVHGGAKRVAMSLGRRSRYVLICYQGNRP